jgi:hypothetical protein
MELPASFARICHFVLSSHAQKLQTESMEVAASFPSATSFCKAVCVSFVSFQNGLLVVYCRRKLLVHYFATNFMIHP